MARPSGDGGGGYGEGVQEGVTDGAGCGTGFCSLLPASKITPNLKK